MIAALTQALIYYLEYRMLMVDDQVYASDVVSFGTYFELMLTKTHMRMGRGAGFDTGEVGSFGYLLALSHFLGFMIGGFVYFILKAQPTCAPCNRYLKTLATKKDRFGNTEALSEYYDVEFAYPVDGPESAAHVGQSFPGGMKAEGGDFNMVTKVLGCPSCGAQTVSETVQVYNGREWKNVEELTRAVQMPEGVEVAHLYKV